MDSEDYKVKKRSEMRDLEGKGKRSENFSFKWSLIALTSMRIFG